MGCLVTLGNKVVGNKLPEPWSFMNVSKTSFQVERAFCFGNLRLLSHSVMESLTSFPVDPWIEASHGLL